MPAINKKVMFQGSLILLFLTMSLNLLANHREMLEIDRFTNEAHVNRYLQAKLSENVSTNLKPKLRNIRRSLKTTSPILMGYGIGPYFSSNLGSDVVMYALSATHHREVAENGEVRLRGGVSFGEDMNTILTSATIGGGFLPIEGEYSPIVGGEFGLAWSKADGGLKNSAGFSGAVFVGYRLFRGTDTNLEVTARYELIFKNNAKGNPGVYGIQVALLMP